MRRTPVSQLQSLQARIDFNVRYRLFFERKNNIRPWNSGEKRECLVILEKAGLYDGHDGVNTSFELSHPKPVLSIGDNVGEGGHMVELTIPGEYLFMMTMKTMIMKTMMINI